jgi:hypothetical protein
VTDAVTGGCDLLRQNCASPFTCGIQQSGAMWRTECVNLGAGSKALGATCAGHSECAIGLRCSANKCTRPCCPQREAEFCGTGQCDLTITFGTASTGYLTVCSFSPPCTLWSNNCPPGPDRDCHVAPGNRFLCDAPNYSLDAGSTVGRSCYFRNDCGDSQYCSFTGADASTGTCRWLCKASTTGAPDAGTIGGAPGQGGCPGGQTCRPFSNPSWLGVCLAP